MVKCKDSNIEEVLEYFVYQPKSVAIKFLAKTWLIIKHFTFIINLAITILTIIPITYTRFLHQIYL